jgi:hypothetical protein
MTVTGLPPRQDAVDGRTLSTIAGPLVKLNKHVLLDPLQPIPLSQYDGDVVGVLLAGRDGAAPPMGDLVSDVTNHSETVTLTSVGPGQ